MTSGAASRGSHASRLLRGAWAGVRSPVGISNWAIFPALGILLAICAVVESNIDSSGNLLLTVQANAPIGLLAVGETFVILTAGIDLSVGAVMGVVNWVAANMINGHNARTPGVALLCLGIGMGVGLINGLGVARLRVPPFVMTLGMLFVVNAIGLLYTNGTPAGTASASLTTLGSDSVGGIPVAAFVLAGGWRSHTSS